MKKLFALVLLLTAVITGQATAAPLTLSWSGVFSADSTLDSVALGADTPFTVEATFDSTADTDPDEGFGMFVTVATFDITGFGVFTSDPVADVRVVLADPSAVGAYFVALSNSALSLGFLGAFATATPPFDADAPMPSVISDFITSNTGFPFVISLAGGGELVINGVVSVGDTTEIAAAPEPTSLLLLGTAGIGLIARRRMRKQT